MIIVMFFLNMLRAARKFLRGWYLSAHEIVGHPLSHYSKMYSRALG